MEIRAAGCGVAALVFGSDDRCLGAIVITMPQIRFDAAKVTALGATIVAADQQLSSRLGSHGEGSTLAR